jgi:hypothetical protein
MRREAGLATANARLLNHLRSAVPWLALGVLYLVSRLYRLDTFPLFVDEGVYAWWGDRILHGDWLRAFGASKPLSAWLVTVAMGLGFDRVVGPRLAHLAVAVVEPVAIGLLAHHFISRRAAFVAVSLWLLAPYALFFERLATPDVILAATGTCTAYLSALSATTSDDLHGAHVWLRFGTGFVVCAAILAKPPVSVFFVICPALAMICLQPMYAWQGRLKALALCYLLPGIMLAAMVLAVAVRWRLHLYPIGFGLEELSKTSVGDGGVVARWLGNANLFGQWLGSYFTQPAAVLVGVSFIAGCVRGPRIIRYLACLPAAYLAALLLFGGWLAPRYLLPVLPELLLIAAWALDSLLGHIEKRASRTETRYLLARWPIYVLAVGCALVLAPALYFDATILVRPLSAPLPLADRLQYIEGAASGFGLAEAAGYLERTVATSPSTVQILTAHVGDYERLLAYLSPAVRDRVRIPRSGGLEYETGGDPRQMAKSQLAVADKTYLLLGWNRWNSAWANAFPGAVLDASFQKPGQSDEPVQVWLLGSTTSR